MSTAEYDVLVAGAGTAGCYAAATVAHEGLDVAILERKSEAEAGHIACGDALKGASHFPDAIPREQIEPAFTNTDVDHGRFEIPKEDTVVDIPIQNGTVEGLDAIAAGEPVSYEADIVIDAAGALSVLQDEADLDDATFDTNVTYSQFCSAYREIVEVEQPVPWDDALVFKPTERSAGYLWYFPRTETEINVGLGFQMNEEPMELIEALKRDIRDREEFEGATVEDKLGAALPTRRPYDSAVAPGFMAVGDAAGHVNPTTGGGIAGAAYAGQYAGEQAIEALADGDLSEDALWRYNERVMDHFGSRYAALDVYNIFSTAYDIDDLMAMLASLPVGKLSEALYSGTADLTWTLKLKIALNSFGHWGTIADLYRTKSHADALMDHYEAYPETPAAFEQWQAERDEILEEVYETTGADAKY